MAEDRIRSSGELRMKRTVPCLVLAASLALSTLADDTVTPGELIVERPSMGIGHAAGAAAGLCTREGIEPRQLSPELLRETLKQQKAFC
jgi:hypothetical protein